jgi:phosphotransferase system IIB component
MSLYSVNSSFVEFRRLAFSANDVGQVQANMLKTSLGVKDFIINGTNESIDQVGNARSKRCGSPRRR